jgi:hypothetical protein
MDDIALLNRAIALSGKSARRFAVEDLSRDERTIRRWIAGDRKLPRPARLWLEAYVAQRELPG